MTISYYDIGDRRKLSCEIRDEDGDLADPSDLTFTMLDPDGVSTEYVLGTDEELVKDSTGVYHVYWDCTVHGPHHYRWEADGTIAVAEESVFRVRRSRVIPEGS